MDSSIYTARYLRKTNPLLFAVIRQAPDPETMRPGLISLADRLEARAGEEEPHRDAGALARLRDCVAVFKGLLKESSEALAGFSVAQALWDIGHDRPRPDLTPGFYAELLYLLLGLQGQGPRKALDSIHLTAINASGRPAARERSRQLDELWAEVDRRMSAFPCGLDQEARARRLQRRERILAELGGSLDDWHNWRWQIKWIIRDLDTLSRLTRLSATEKRALREALKQGLPFGITPYYLSLMDAQPGGPRDTAIRAQVLPPMSYVKGMAGPASGDFMGEEDTSPFDLITRRYPAICILKPFNSCPQICVYCQRNWEIEDAMAPGSFAGMNQVEAAIQWINDHPAIHEVLLTGGDPLAMGNAALEEILGRLAAIPTVERIRIGTRTVVTIPMRISEGLALLIGRFRQPGRREVAVVTHVQHPYEITPETMAAVDRLRRQGIPVYNQLVYTFHISRRFEAASLRRTLRLIGVDPYYTFNTKGKDETLAYRVPIARLLQEQQEEARLLPGLARGDEAVFNIPRLGKNYLRAKEYRNLVSILPTGERLYEFHSWENKVSQESRSYLFRDLPLLDYLRRLKTLGESDADYETIWYYY